MKTAAAILVEQRRPLVLDEVEVPAPGFGQVLVRILSTRICGSQIGEIDGVKGPEAGVPCRGKDHVGSLFDLRER